MTNKHTPLKERPYDPAYPNQRFIDISNGYIEINGASRARDYYAELIPRAVNNHDELVEACRQAIAGLKEKHLEDYEREDLINFIEERLKNATEVKQ